MMESFTRESLGIKKKIKIKKQQKKSFWGMILNTESLVSDRVEDVEDIFFLPLSRGIEAVEISAHRGAATWFLSLDHGGGGGGSRNISPKRKCASRLFPEQLNISAKYPCSADSSGLTKPDTEDTRVRPFSNQICDGSFRHAAEINCFSLFFFSPPPYPNKPPYTRLVPRKPSGS